VKTPGGLGRELVEAAEDFGIVDNEYLGRRITPLQPDGFPAVEALDLPDLAIRPYAIPAAGHADFQAVARQLD
jgi:hypothetical protein